MGEGSINPTVMANCPSSPSGHSTVATPGSHRECQGEGAAETGKGAIAIVSALFIPPNSGKDGDGVVSTCV